MRDQAAACVDGVSQPLVADFDARDHIPDELEIYFGDRDAGFIADARHRDGHVRLGFLAEVDRAEVRFARLRHRELGILGNVLVAARDVHAQA